MNLDKKIEKIIEEMPSLPITVAKILEITKDPESTPNDLNQVITLDPVLTGKVLRLVNSAYYNLSNQVTSIVKAIIMLGINTIKNLSISTAVLGTIRNKSQFIALNMDAFWRHSLAVGVTAKLIATKMGVDPKQRDEYFIAGLLHDIGKIIMNQHFSELYMDCIHKADLQRQPLWLIEQNTMETNHSMIGFKVAKHWQLSPALKEAISLHHAPLQATPDAAPVVFAVAIADVFCVDNEIGFSGNRTADLIPQQVWDKLHISEDILFDLEDQIATELEKASVFLQIDSEED